MRIVCRPLTDWPGQLRSDAERNTGRQFRAGWSNTTSLLEREADMIGGREIVIQLAIPDYQIRRDGWPYARVQPAHPGVTIVVPDTHHGRLSWSTDRYADWKHNVRAIALSMEALRAADRHGVMQGRQYAGFRELGAGAAPSASGGRMSVEDAARFVATWGGSGWHDVLERPEIRSDSLRRAAKHLHPDTGGDPDKFRRLQEAKQLLEREGVG